MMQLRLFDSSSLGVVQMQALVWKGRSKAWSVVVCIGLCVEGIVGLGDCALKPRSLA